MTGSITTSRKIPPDDESRVSVVIVSWNTKPYLSECLQSLCDGETRKLEIVVVDNCSTDGSPEMVESDYPNVNLIRSESNVGFAKANNVGIRASTGDYICLINSDVRVCPNCISELLTYLDENPTAGMVGPRVFGGDGILQRSCRGFPTLWNMTCRAFALDAIFPGVRCFGGYLLRYWKQDTRRPVQILSGCFWLVKVGAIEKVGLLDESFFMYGEDMDWCKRFNASGFATVFIPQAQIIHYGGASSSNAPVRFFIEKQRADLQYWRKHHGALGQKLYHIISCVHHLLRVFGHLVNLFSKRGVRSDEKAKITRSWQCLKWLCFVSHNNQVLTKVESNSNAAYAG